MASAKYPLPLFLAGRITPDTYLRWLGRKAMAHVKRDRKRGNDVATREAYMVAIHGAVVASDGKDAYTGEDLEWHLVSKYDNVESKAGKRAYKRSLCLLPTVDHVGDGTGAPDFLICSWRTNDCKNDLSRAELVEFCRAVIAHHSRVSE